MSHKSEIAVVGQGYVGLELSIAAAKAGYVVHGVDKSAERIHLLSSGYSPIENILSSELEEVLSSGNYHPTTDFAAVKNCRIVVLCVPTPIHENGEPNLGYLKSAVQDIAPWLSPHTLVINESTSFPGTLREFIQNELFKSRHDLRGELHLAVAPERVSPGNQIPLKDIPRVVSGLDEVSTNEALDFYRSFCNEVHAARSPEIAEMSKLLENTFRQINIAFINEFSIICRKLGIDVREVIEAAKTKPYGFMAFQPSAGIGGHCIPVDPMYLQLAAEKVGFPSAIIDAAFQSNLKHGAELIELVFLGAKTNRLESVLILGVAYKAGLSDTRESPAIRIATHLKTKSIRVGWLDPLVNNFLDSPPSDLSDDWDCAVIVTAQDNLPIEELMSRKVPIFDFTGVFSFDKRITQI